MTLQARAGAVLDGIAGALSRIDETQVARACETIGAARTVMLYGCGREGLMMQAFAMRLHHLGLAVSMQGDMAAPPLGRGDLFVASAGPGHLSTVEALMRTARMAGADVLFLTAVPDAPAATLATHHLVIPAQTMANDAGASEDSPMGSGYEGALFVLFEAMVADLAARLGQDAASMRARHTNME
ncbi:SIS domain-containing protein [Rhodobacterales bacterium HKCCE2091]|nr:SIS domain-containing protein [Rhodobacterales bacterium HKCCE2091]